MGIPYSKQIDAAFAEVTPLVQEGFQVLETTRNISFMLAIIQVLTVILLSVAVVALVGLLITLNPDLKEERRALVTPIVRHIASWVMPGSEGRWILRAVGWTLFAMWICGLVAAAFYFSMESREMYRERKFGVGGGESSEKTDEAEDMDRARAGVPE